MANTIEVTITVDGKEATVTLTKVGDGIKKVGDKSQQASKPAKGFRTELNNLAREVGLAVTLGALVKGLGDFVVESFNAAAAAERLGAATNSMAQGIGESGESMVKAITESSNETISRTAAMEAANKAMLFNLVENSGQMEEMTQIAITLGAAMGQNATKSLDDLTTALGRQSPMILDNLGITLKLEEAYKIYAEELGKTVDALTEEEKKQAFVNAALIKGREAVEQLGGANLDSAATTEQLSAAWSDFQVAFGSLLTEVSGGIQMVTAFIRLLEKGADAWKFVFGEAIPAIREYQKEQAIAESVTIKTNNATIAASTSLGDYFQTIKEQHNVQLAAVAAMEKYELSQMAIVTTSGELINATEILAEAQRLETEAVEGLTPATREYQKEQAIAESVTIKTNNAIAKYRQNIQASTPIVEKAAEAIDILAVASLEVNEAQRLAQISAQELAEEQLAVQQEAEEYSDLLSDQTQNQIELTRIQNIARDGLTGYGEDTRTAAEQLDAYTEAQEEATKAEEERLATLFELAMTQADFFNSFADLQAKTLTNEQNFSSNLASIRQEASDKLKDTEEQLSEDLTEIEQKRQDKLHWVLTGAHARSAEQNAIELANVNRHFDELKEDTIAKATERTDGIIAEQDRADSAARAAREKEKADMAAHLEELKILTSLSALETTGQLEQITGLVGVSAREAASLIQAGLLPVTQELGLAMQDTLSGLESNMAAASGTAEANQSIIQEALAGTLTSTQELGAGTEEELGLINTAFGEQLPASIGTTNESMSAFLENANAGAATLQEESLLPFQTTLDELSTITLPTLSEIWTILIELMTTQLTTLTTVPLTNFIMTLSSIYLVHIPALSEAWSTATADILLKADLIISKLANEGGLIDIIKDATKAAVDFGEDSVDSMKDAAKAIKDKLIPAIEDAIEKFEDMKDAANDAAAAARGTGGSLNDTGLGGDKQHGGPVRKGISYLVGEVGPEIFTPNRSGFIIPNDQLPGRQSNTTNNYYFQQTVNTRAESSTVIGDFKTMQLLLGT
jgi:hypothetical protein